MLGRRVAPWIGTALCLAALGWAAFYFYEAFLIGSMIHWRFTAPEYGQAALVGIGPLALTVTAITLMTGKLRRQSKRRA